MPLSPYEVTHKKYIDASLPVIPLASGDKRPIEDAWSQYCKALPDKATIAKWLAAYPAANIGLPLGCLVREGLQLVAIDIDDAELQDKVLRAIDGDNAPYKVGGKGRTIFCLATADVVSRKLKRKGPDGKPLRAPSVEVLAAGNQTVLPPSIHPKTQQPYTWGDGRELLDYLNELPLIDTWTVDELECICDSKDRTIEDLNSMTWLGVDNGGDTHDTCLAAVATLVARGWPDDAIQGRINRAKREAVEKAGDKYHWPQATKVIQGWIDSAREKGMEGKAVTSRQKSPPLERIMADWGLNSLGGINNLATLKGQLRRYSTGYWPLVNIDELEKTMFFHSPIVRKSDVDNAVDIMHRVTKRSDFEQGKWLCLLNGTLDVKAGTLVPHDPRHGVMHQVPVSWDETALCPTYDSVVDFTFGGDAKAIALWDEYCGLTLVDDMSFQKLLFLKGAGGNGKGTLARVLSSIHDPAAISSIAITDLGDERKRTALVGKLVNISGEQSRLQTIADTYLKKITGGDPVDVRKLYGETEANVRLSVRFIELVNEMPATSDTSEALRRRMIILTCPNRVEKPDIHMDAKLLAERAGILLRWVRALQRLYARGEFDIPESSTAQVDEYLLENDLVRMWAEDRCEDHEPGEAGTENGELYGDFRGWLDANGFQYKVSSVSWGKRMTSLGYPSDRRRAGKITIRCRGLRVRPGTTSFL